MTDQIWTFTCSRCEYRIKVMDWQTTPRCPEHDCLLDLVDVQNEVKEVVMKYQMFGNQRVSLKMVTLSNSLYVGRTVRL